jgi:hypothetical protein
VHGVAGALCGQEGTRLAQDREDLGDCADDAHDIVGGGGPKCVAGGEFGVRVPFEIMRVTGGVGGARQGGDAENLRQEHEGVERRVLQQRIERHDFGATHTHTHTQTHKRDNTCLDDE